MSVEQKELSANRVPETIYIESKAKPEAFAKGFANELLSSPPGALHLAPPLELG